AHPGRPLSLARLDGKPAATAILYVADKVGYCADAATNPAFRGRGLQTALLHRRIADASAAGVDFVCGGADFLSPSHRNMEHAGMRVLVVRGLWAAPYSDRDPAVPERSAPRSRGGAKAWPACCASQTRSQQRSERAPQKLAGAGPLASAAADLPPANIPGR